jgi:hypothetical protein
MTCDDFKAFTKRHPLTLTTAENSAIRNHVHGCSDCSHLVLQWMWRAKVKPSPREEEYQRIADFVNARVDADPETTNVRVIGFTTNERMS